MIALDELESVLWGAAVLLRGKINATGYKEYIFPLVFFKRISDVHNEERARALELGGGDEEFADQPENYSFAIPPGCLWEDVRGVTQRSLRRNIGILQQDVFMFAGTVRENIRYGRPDATDEEIVEAAKRAEIHQEILAMPDGYDSYIGERGVMLSGGQKQRLSIARVFLKNPKVLILDEATSALDTVTEQRIQRSLDELSVGRTTIVIAHRLSTVKHADCIAVVEGEHIIEMGSHQELMAKNGAYAALCRAQNLEG